MGNLEIDTRRRVVTTQQTSKRYKAGIAAGWLMSLSGFGLAMAGPYPPGGFALAVAGCVVLFTSRLLAWWNHA